jgi:hypothetical protein
MPLCDHCIYRGKDERVNSLRSCDLFDFPSPNARNQHAMQGKVFCQAFEQVKPTKKDHVTSAIRRKHRSTKRPI